MTSALITILVLAIAFCATIPAAKAETMGHNNLPSGSPILQKQGGVVQLYVDGKPFLILGGEVFNSSSSSLDYMAPIWTHMIDLHANTVLAPVSWEQIEPTEGKFDFSVVDGLIQGARAHNLHLVLLWMASWKNGMSSYTPDWVKADYTRFPLARRQDGSPVQVLSTLSDANWTADATAFAALMRHLRDFDGRDHTVLMMQVENEVGLLGDSRDRSDAANAAFAGQVPSDLMGRLTANDADLVPEFRNVWVQAGQKPSGTWEDVFGSGPQADEIFMAWNYARYVDHVAAAGKAEYPIPMYVNAWLNDPMDSKPGAYPSGCPESHLIDIWQAAAPHIDLLAPDIYAANFQDRCDLYTRRGNTLFIPEMPGNDIAARNVFAAIGRYNALGTSPFGIDRTPSDGPISQSYDLLSQIAPMILQHQANGETIGFVLDADHPQFTFAMDGYELDVSLDTLFGHTATDGYGIIVATAPNQFTGAGSGFRVTFKPTTPGPQYAGIGTVKEGTFTNGQWTPARWLNGDETAQGQTWRFSSMKPGIEECTVYRYE
jgi:beta-galactosidase GanA